VGVPLAFGIVLSRSMERIAMPLHSQDDSDRKPRGNEIGEPLAEPVLRADGTRATAGGAAVDRFACIGSDATSGVPRHTFSTAPPLSPNP